MGKLKESFRCVDCSEYTFVNIIDYYMVHEEVWEKYGVGENMLCVRCLEKRMKRQLKFKDLTLCIVNIDNPYTRNIIKTYIREYEKKLELKYKI